MDDKFQSVEAQREKHRVALTSLLAAVALTGTKLAIGIWTNSLGILSEAAHSGLDLLAAGITLWAVWIASRPADDGHTYGHGKFENLSALTETLLLLVTCVWIIFEASRRLFFGANAEVDANAWAFVVIVFSIVVDYTRSRALSRVAKKHNSQALEADALHFSTDIWSSLVVLLGLVGVRIGEWANLKWLEYADAVAALGVSAIVISVSLRLGKKSVDDLVDSVSASLPGELAAAAASVAGVEAVTRVRVRRSGPKLFADMSITVDHGVGMEAAHEIAHKAEAAVRAVSPWADVVVHLEPTKIDPSDVAKTARTLAARYGMAVHEIGDYQQDEHRWMEMHLEVEPSLALGVAHDRATRFEKALMEAIPGLSRIVTHLEPAGQNARSVQAVPEIELRIEGIIRDYVRNDARVSEPHRVTVQAVEEGIEVSLHCRVAAETTVTEAHRISQDFEAFLRRRIPLLQRVLIHVEPAKTAT